ncbi:Uncharacterised protein [Yersinia nurmii]|nr:hypothetical protein [Yersinia nurmii]CNE61280.1 Uncharacterised protein [Yersinia nurmii]
MADFLPANIGIPIFSEKAMGAIRDFIPESVKGVECIISCEGRQVTYNLCWVGVYLNLVDEEKSSFRTLSDGDKILTKAIYKSDFQYDFMIARDAEFKERLVVSQGFVDFCHSKKLNVNFGEPI